jgi:predicted HTH transcriptional regulator
LRRLKKIERKKMYPDKLKEIIISGESSTVEFKRKISSYEKIAREISAFANTLGGYLIIGVDDDGKIVGIDSEKSSFDQIEEICGFYIDPPIEPDIDIVNISNKDIIVVYINESNKKPHRIHDNGSNSEYESRAYIRVGDKSLIASREMERVLAGLSPDSKPLKLSIGDKEKRLFAFLEKNEKATVKDFARIVNISERRASRLLVRLVRAGVLQIHVDNNSDFFTLVDRIDGQ